MSNILVRIKRAVLAGRYDFSDKAIIEIECDNLDERDIVESILNATEIHKTLRSTSPRRSPGREYLHVIVSENLDGISIYTKGKLTGNPGEEVYYFLVSAKRDLES